MKTKEEILDNYDLDFQDGRAYFTQDVLLAMEEYANQDIWISVDIEPEFDGRYLCFIEQEQECGNVWRYCQVRDNSINIWTTLHNEKVTHWQPLPNPPTK